MARPALTALTLAAALAAASAPDPCCLRVTPYHIQALAQRMAQRFQALEYRAQDLRYVFASFQAVHGNVSHRLRFLEAEHAHLSELVGRLDSRVQSLEEEKRMEQYRQQVAYYSRGPRHTAVRTPIDDLLKSRRKPPFMMRRRRNEHGSDLPHLFVHLDQSKESFEKAGNISVATSTDTVVTRPPIQTSSEQLTSDSQIIHLNLSATSQPSTVSSDSEQLPTPHSPAFLSILSEASPQIMHNAPARDSVTIPTPLWQLEETASALLNAMSAGDDDVGDANVPSGTMDDAVSYWSPANETDSLEELFNSRNQEPTLGEVRCTGQTTGNCNKEKLKKPTEGASNIGTSTDVTVSNSSSKNSLNTSSDVGFSQHDALPNITLATENGSANYTNSDRGTSDVDLAKTSGCETENSALPAGEIPLPSDNATNLTRLLLDMGNDTGSLLDLFPAGATPPPDGDGGAAELSDAELQAALRELDALLQRPPASAQAPDPEKALLKRALTLALAALERTSDACLKLVNFTADAFEGMAATEA